MANVKHTTNNGEILTTNCKRVTTALKRFAEFLDNYDNIYNDMLSKINNDNNTKDTESDTKGTESDNENKDNVTISLGSLDDVKIDLSQESNKTPAELKTEINNKYGVNTVYYDIDSIMCDAEKQNVYVVKHNTNDTKDTESDTKDTESDTKDTESDTNKTSQQTYNIKAYYDGKELTIPCDKYKCKQYVVEYIKALYENHDVEYETLFIIYYGKHAETITIENVLDVVDLIEYNIDDINNGLKNDCYNKVREGFVNLCTHITDNKVIIELITPNTSQTYSITNSRFEGLYTFKSDNMCRTQSPESFARWLYYHTFTHKIILNYAEGDIK